MQRIKKLLPAWLAKALRPFYHGLLSLSAHYIYGRPSNQLITIGITGTAGKSTTIALLAHILNSSGRKTGYITTVGFHDGSQETVNWHGRSMPGRFLLQKQLHQMLKNNCRYAVVEVTSEGLAQNRHWGLQFDLAALTNLGEAHFDAHGGFENYKRAKGRLFAKLLNTAIKAGGPPKTIVVNLDAKDADYFLQFKAEQKIGVLFDTAATAHVLNRRDLADIYIGEGLKVAEGGSQFKLRDIIFRLSLPGEFNAKNALLATACANALGVDLKDCAKALAGFTAVLGRMQEVPNFKGLKIIVDYAPEPVAMENALVAANSMPHQRLIHVFGSTGGHRDIAKRFLFGQISARYSDTIFITNDDVYDSDPEEIAQNIKQGIDQVLHKKTREVNIILDRRQALAAALQTARPGDLILVTGKGSEQFLVLPGDQKIPWDEVSVIKDLL